MYSQFMMHGQKNITLNNTVSCSGIWLSENYENQNCSVCSVFCQVC